MKLREGSVSERNSRLGVVEYRSLKNRSKMINDTLPIKIEVGMMIWLNYFKLKPFECAFLKFNFRFSIKVYRVFRQLVCSATGWYGVVI